MVESTFLFIFELLEIKRKSCSECHQDEIQCVLYIHMPESHSIHSCHSQSLTPIIHLINCQHGLEYMLYYLHTGEASFLREKFILLSLMERSR